MRSHHRPFIYESSDFKLMCALVVRDNVAKRESSVWHVARLLVILIVGFVTLMLLAPPVRADMPKTPSIVWFTFDYETSQAVTLEGVQVVICPDHKDKCEPSLLHLQYGVCDQSECLPGPPELTEPNEYDLTFECVGKICRVLSIDYAGQYYLYPPFKLIAQFSDRVRVSPVVERVPPSYKPIDYYRSGHPAWQVTVTDPDLFVVKDTAKGSFLRLSTFSLSLVSNLIIELIVAVVFLLGWMRFDVKLPLLNLLVIVVLVNLITLPVVWFFFPSLGQFQPGYNRFMGGVILILANLFALLLISIYRTQGILWRVGLIIFGIFFLGVVLAAFYFSFLVVILMFLYSLPVVGLSPGVILILAETFAVLYETMLIVVLSKGGLSWRQAGLMSLLMNAASFMGGLLIFRFSLTYVLSIPTYM